MWEHHNYLDNTISCHIAEEMRGVSAQLTSGEASTLNSVNLAGMAYSVVVLQNSPADVGTHTLRIKSDGFVTIQDCFGVSALHTIIGYSA